MSQYLKRIDIANVGNVAEEQQSHYLKRVHVVEVIDQDGNPWEPAPGPDPWDELVVVEKADWKDENVYIVGEDVEGRTATYTGGNPENTIYRSRLQTRASADDNWDTTAWENHPNEFQFINRTLPAAGQCRFQTQARDNTDPDNVVQVNSFASIKDVAWREFGDITVTVNDIEYNWETAPTLTILLNDPMPVEVSITGDASPTYEWDARNEYPLMVGQQAASTVLTFPQEGMASVTCTLSDSNTEEKSISLIINFFVVDALD